MPSPAKKCERAAINTCEEKVTALWSRINGSLSDVRKIEAKEENRLLKFLSDENISQGLISIRVYELDGIIGGFWRFSADGAGSAVCYCLS